MITIYLNLFSNNFSLFEEKSIKIINFSIIKKNVCIHHDLPSKHVDSFYNLLRHTMYPLFANTPLHLTWVRYLIIQSSLGIFCFSSVWWPKISAKHDWGKISEKKRKHTHIL